MGLNVSPIYCFRVLTSPKCLQSEISANEYRRKGAIARGLFPITVPTAILIPALQGCARETETILKCAAAEWWIPAALPPRRDGSCLIKTFLYVSLSFIHHSMLYGGRRWNVHLKPKVFARNSWHSTLLTAMNKKKKFWSAYPQDIMSFIDKHMLHDTYS